MWMWSRDARVLVCYGLGQFVWFVAGLGFALGVETMTRAEWSCVRTAKGSACDNDLPWSANAFVAAGPVVVLIGGFVLATVARDSFDGAGHEAYRLLYGAMPLIVAIGLARQAGADGARLRMPVGWSPRPCCSLPGRWLSSGFAGGSVGVVWCGRSPCRPARPAHVGLPRRCRR